MLAGSGMSSSLAIFRSLCIVYAVMCMQYAIEATGLRKAYADTPVLAGVDLQVRPGAIFSLLGPNGAGKTTTVRLFCTLLRPDAGPPASPGSTSSPTATASAARSASPGSTPPSTSCRRARRTCA